MPRRYFRPLLPDPRKLLPSGQLRFLGDRLHEPSLWHLNRQSFATGCSIGLFMAFMPVPGQMILAALAAIALRGNLAVSITTVWVSNPVTIPPLFYLCYRIGTAVLDLPQQAVSFELTLQWFGGQFLAIWQPLLLGSFIMACASGVLGYMFAQGLWRILVVQLWTARQRRRARKLKKRQQ